MRYLLLFTLLVIGTAAADTCTVSGKMVQCNDGSRITQQGNVIVVTPGDKEMGSYNGQGSNAYGLGAAALDSATRYQAARGATAVQRQGIEAEAEFRANQLGQADKFHREDQAFQTPVRDAQVSAADAQRQQALAAIEQRATELKNNRDIGMAGVGVQAQGVKNQNDQYYYGQNNLSAAQKAEIKIRDEGDAGQRATRAAQASTNYADSLAASRQAKDPKTHMNETVTLTNSFLATPDGAGAAVSFFGPGATDMKIKPTAGGLLPLANVNGKVMTLAADGVTPVEYDPSRADYHTIQDTSELEQHARGYATIMGGQTNSVGSAAAAKDAAVARQDQEKAKLDIVTLRNQADKDTLATNNAFAVDSATKADAANSRLGQGLRAVVGDDTTPGSLSKQFDLNATGDPLGIVTPATSMTKNRAELIGGKGALPKDVIVKTLQTQIPAIVKNPATLQALREHGMQIPNKPFEQWSQDEVNNFTSSAAQGVMALFQNTEGNPFADGLQEGELAQVAGGATPAGAMPSAQPKYKNEGLGRVLNYF